MTWTTPGGRRRSRQHRDSLRGQAVGRRRSRRGLTASRQRLRRVDALRRLRQRRTRRIAATSWCRARATAAGRSRRRIEISDDTGDATDSDGTVEGVVPAVGPNGDVYIAWAGPKGLVIRQVDRRRLDVRHATSVITAMPGGWDLPVPGLERHNGMPVTAVDLERRRRQGQRLRQLDRRAQRRPRRVRGRVARRRQDVVAARARQRRWEGRGADVHVAGRRPGPMGR